jgi:hypothetical protein
MSPLLLNKGILHRDSLAKNAAAFTSKEFQSLSLWCPFLRSKPNPTALSARRTKQKKVMLLFDSTQRT